MLDDGTGGDGATPSRAPFDGAAADARARSRELRLQLSATRARLSRLRRAGLDQRGRPDTAVDVFKQVQEQLLAAREQIVHLETALTSNRRIGIAIGIVMARNQLTDEAAFELLREQSQLRNQKLRELAEEVIYTGML
ncbi:ANTAR domain-containing protein [Petropleomorpha daqingensis]|uniref:Tetrahydromethanopterin S-methyltransferase subunit F n=1 Tax=Petropleomorpha daqingensis TaxID=2026353 RepID=A0A853CLJ9_9ACTN|nr:ANTAR domain-containing protein [Petropleomorpha daqingensis]NYJ06833.1 tetrahydromethanopterin S-methyltransferase subunit F [Petropleomorpha daqingensis]